MAALNEKSIRVSKPWFSAGGPGGLSVSAARVADGEDGAPETPAVAASTTENEEVSHPESYCV